MKKYIPKPQNIKVFVQAVDGQQLMDKRSGHIGLVFGVIPDICKQYDIRTQQVDGGFILIGPAKRMQILVEKLHFAGVSYFEV